LPKQTLAIARSGGADVLVLVKENQPDLLAMCQMLAQYRSPSQQHVDHDKGHGRIETRMIDTFIPPNAWLPEGWQPLVQAVVKVVRVIEHKRKGMAQSSEETAWWVEIAMNKPLQGADRHPPAGAQAACPTNRNHHRRGGAQPHPRRCTSEIRPL
jgi:hypothetical protein